jgi:endonuclease G, mitochondrial
MAKKTLSVLCSTALLLVIPLSISLSQTEPLPTTPQRIGGWYPLFFSEFSQAPLDVLIGQIHAGQIARVVIHFDEQRALAERIHDCLLTAADFEAELAADVPADTPETQFDHQRVSLTVTLQAPP